MSNHSEITAICQLIDSYYESAFTGDLPALRATFDATCIIDGHFANEAWRADLETYMAAMAAAPSAASLGFERDCEIVSIDMTGKVAFVKLRESLGGLRFVDYLILGRGEAGWRITHKGYHSPDALPGA